MNAQLIFLIASYITSGFVSTQLTIPSTQQLSVRLVLAGLLALPIIKWRNLITIPPRSALLCILGGISGYGIGAWAFIHAISLGGYGTAVFITSLPWLGLLDLFVRGSKVCRREKFALAVSSFGCVVFFLPALRESSSLPSTFQVVLWSCISSVAVSFAQYARRFHAPEISSSVVADGVILTAFLLGVMSWEELPTSLGFGDLTWLVVGALCYLASNRLSSTVFQNLSPAKVSVALSSEPAIALALSLIFLPYATHHEEFLGASILVIATVISHRRIRSHQTDSSSGL